MRWYISVGAVLLAGAVAGGDVTSFAAPSSRNQVSRTQLSDNKDKAAAVDIELILAVDVSYSMDMDELAVQREGAASTRLRHCFVDEGGC